ncbi:MAG: hypothetical protein JXR37_27810 [Kiritimatiellae bacterium]|nr:hypothetical protein [Kiritimatiellia bacterium]
MKCFNCGKNVPDGATACKYCEADLRQMDGLAPEALEQALKHIPADAMAEMRKMAEQYDTAEDFANAIFVGDCPKCGSEQVGTFEEVAGIEDPTIARCFACGHMWCAECGEPIADPNTRCGHWLVCEKCGKEEDCPYIGDPFECGKLAAWLEQAARRRAKDDGADAPRPSA